MLIFKVSWNLILPGEAFSPRGYYSRHPKQVIHIHIDEIKGQIRIIFRISLELRKQLAHPDPHPGLCS